MPYADDAPDRPDPILAAARIGDLTRLALWLEQPWLTLDDVRRHVAERLECLYPIDFHVYRQRWQALDAERRPGPLLSFLAWWPLAQELAERAAVAGLLGEEDGRVEELRGGAIGGGGMTGAFDRLVTSSGISCCLPSCRTDGAAQPQMQSGSLAADAAGETKEIKPPSAIPRPHLLPGLLTAAVRLQSRGP